MAVRESLLGILTLGPAYGLQLHAELGARAEKIATGEGRGKGVGHGGSGALWAGPG